MKPPVTNKKDFTRRYAAGEFGNASPTWSTLAEFYQAHLGPTSKVLYSLRCKIPGGPCYYNLNSSEVVHQWTCQPLGADNFYVSEMAPHHIGTINGEVCRTIQGLNLFYGPGDVPMREALKQGKQVTGLQADMILRAKVDPSGYNWIMELLEEYPGHTVEFTSFAFPWGTLASVGHCTVIWEVRLY